MPDALEGSAGTPAGHRDGGPSGAGVGGDRPAQGIPSPGPERRVGREAARNPRPARGGHPPLGELARLACGAAHRAVWTEAEALGAPPRALATTLLVVVWRSGHAAAAHVGDGAALACRAGVWDVLSPPAEGEYVNETRFLTDPDWERHIRLGAAGPDVEGVVAFSDGCQRAALLRDGPAAWRPFPGFLDPLARFARGTAGAREARRQLAGLLDSAKMRQASDDDKTLALIWRRTGRA